MNYVELKQLVWERDNYICRYCGTDLYNNYALWLRWVCFHNKKWGYRVPTKERPTVDHVIPRSKGGETTTANLVTCCQPCNTEKDNKSW